MYECHSNIITLFLNEILFYSVCFLILTIIIIIIGMQKLLHRYSSHSDQVWSVSYDKSDQNNKRFSSVGDDGMIMIYE